MAANRCAAWRIWCRWAGVRLNAHSSAAAKLAESWGAAMNPVCPSMTCSARPPAVVAMTGAAPAAYASMESGRMARRVGHGSQHEVRHDAVIVQ